MGNDEFILYIRRHNRGCKLYNDDLGRKIWDQIKNVLDPNAIIVAENRAAQWDVNGTEVARDKLPKTAAQFEFDRAILPELFTFLDQL